MYLQKLVLDNFRQFDHLEIDFDPKITVLVGDNGYGKSAILDAAAIALGTYLIHLPAGQQRTIEKTDARTLSFEIGSTIEHRPQFPVKVSAEADMFNRQVNWTRELRGEKNRATRVDAKEMTGISDRVSAYLEGGSTGRLFDSADVPTTLPLVAYYGTGRLWAQSRGKGDSRSRTSRRENAYVKALSPKADNQSMEDWLYDATIQGLEQGRALPELRAVQAAVSECLQRVTGAESAKAYYDTRSRQFVVSYRQERQGGASSDIVQVESFPLARYSDGYRTTLSMVADIAYRAAQLNPQLGENSVARTPGVVLIDEVDLHLHPKWQARILGDLAAIFPSMQFVVTTHSPSVVASVPREKLRMLDDRGGVSLPGNETYGRDVASVYREVLGASERPIEVQRLFDAASAALDDDRFDDADRLLAEIESKIGQNDPELTGLRTSLYLARL